jgi:hypothetical protein
MISLGLGLWSTTILSRLGFSPSALFANNEPGVWYDDFLETTFTDTAGTTPATVGSAVALMLDKSKGLVLGPELVTNGTFDTDTSGWSPVSGPASVTVSSGQVTITNAAGDGLSGISQSLTVVVGKTYIVSSELVSATGSAQIRVGIAAAGLEYYVGTSNQIIFTATNTSMAVGVYCNTAGGSATWDNISVKELPGFHATQSVTAARPILARVPARGRANLLTRTEEFDNADWVKSNSTITANATTAPDGTLTAEKIVDNTTNGAHYALRSGFPVVSGVTYTHSAYLKAAERTLAFLGAFDGSANFGASFDLSAGAVSGIRTGSNTSASIVDAGNGWYRCAITFTSTRTGTSNFFSQIGIITTTGDWASPNYIGDGVSGLFLWGAQTETSSTASAYQKVTSTYDVTEAGQADNYFLWFDGIDDSMVTPTITPGIDKVQVFAGVRKLSDAAVGAVLETSTNFAENAGTLFMAAPANVATGNYGWNTRGTGSPLVRVEAAPFPAPVTNVVAGISDIAASSRIIRVNGLQLDSSTSSLGATNFLAYPLHIGSRGGTALRFNGQLFQLITRFGANLDANVITQTETYVASKTAGVSI